MQELLKAEVPVAVGVHEVACLILCSSESRLRALREPVLFDTMSKTAAIIAGECAVDTFFDFWASWLALQPMMGLGRPRANALTRTLHCAPS